MHIKRPVTEDGLVGYDEFDQFMVTCIERGHETSTHIHDVREQICQICNHGWEPNGPSMRDQFRWQLLEAFVHESCLARHQGLVERQDFYSALCNAPVRFRGLVAIPNQYWGPADVWGKNKPWYRAELIDFPVRFVLGRRKRVDSIELIPEGGTKLLGWESAKIAFDDQNVTKEFSEDRILLHAYGDDAKDYIKKLAEACGLQYKRA